MGTSIVTVSVRFTPTADFALRELLPLKKKFLPESCFDSHIGVLLIWLYTHFQCLLFVRILTCGYKCGYNYLFLIINYIDISLLSVTFESGLRTIGTSIDVDGRLFCA